MCENHLVKIRDKTVNNFRVHLYEKENHSQQTATTTKSTAYLIQV